MSTATDGCWYFWAHAATMMRIDRAVLPCLPMIFPTSSGATRTSNVIGDAAWLSCTVAASGTSIKDRTMPNNRAWISVGKSRIAYVLTTKNRHAPFVGASPGALLRCRLGPQVIMQQWPAEANATFGSRNRGVFNSVSRLMPNSRAMAGFLIPRSGMAFSTLGATDSFG